MNHIVTGMDTGSDFLGLLGGLLLGVFSGGSMVWFFIISVLLRNDIN